MSGKGIPVTLVEKHARAGGKIRQARVAGKMIDAGPTVFTMRWVFEALFKEAGLNFDEHVTLHENSLLARHSWVGSDRLDLYTDVQQSADAIELFAGVKEAQRYRKFADKAEALFDTLNKPFMQAERPTPLSLAFAHGVRGFVRMSQTQPYLSLWRALSQSFTDPRLIQLFARYSTYCGSSPLQAPATLMLIAHVERAGVWVIDGGMQALADALLNAAKALGCQCIFGHAVAEILTDSIGVSGVKLDNGTQLNASAVVFNGDTNALANGALGAACSKAVPNIQSPSLSAVTRCEVAHSQGFDLAHHNVFFGENYQDEFNSIFKQQKLCNDPTVYVCAQDRLDDDTTPITSISNHHQTTNEKPTERLFSLMNAPAKALSETNIETALGTMTQTLSRHGLELTHHQSQSAIDTPNSFATLFPETDGALYGRPTHGMMGSFNRPGTKSAISGLYLAGGSVHPGPGVPMVALSGQIAARKILSDWNN